MATGSSDTAPSSAILCEDDLAVLYETLYPARNKYRKLTLQIGVKISEIESVEMKESDPGDRLLQILAIRLKKRNVLTWRDIATALRTGSVGESKLAAAIRKKYNIFSHPEGSSEDEHEKEKKEDKAMHHHKMSEPLVQEDSDGGVSKRNRRKKKESECEIAVSSAMNVESIRENDKQYEERDMATGSSDTTPSSAVLCEDDLGVLYEALYPARIKYRALALQIGVKISEIESVEMKESDPGERLLQILAIRLKKREILTWNNIDAMLRTGSVGESTLADAIRKKYNIVAIALKAPQNLSMRNGANLTNMKEIYHEKLRAEYERKMPKLTPATTSQHYRVAKQQNQYEGEMKELVNIFERYFGQLCCVEFNPNHVAAKLRRKELISIKEMKHMMQSPECEQEKIISLVDKLHNKIRSHPGHLFEIIEVMLENKALQETAKEMLREAGTPIYIFYIYCTLF